MKKVLSLLAVMFFLLSHAIGQNDTLIRTYKDFDFTPGDKIIYYNDFSLDTLGKYPQKWLTNSPSEIKSLKQYPGIVWFEMNLGSTNSTDGKINFQENTTIDFDLIANVGPDSTKPVSEIQIYFHSYKPDELFGDYAPGNGGFGIKYIDEMVSFYSWKKGDFTEIAGQIPTPVMEDNKSKKVHISVSIQASRVLFYVNQYKIFDVPNLVPDEIPALDRISFFSNGHNVSSSLLISNLRVAVDFSELRSKLNKSGKFSTDAITFDNGTDKIRPESYAVLKEIANIINDNSDRSFQIVGYTDNSGNEGLDMELSKKRAESVKKTLTENFFVDGNKLSTDGKGGTSPLNKNQTYEEKAVNRRIEIIRL
jgi:OmpA-OmpF porin, OOP family